MISLLNYFTKTSSNSAAVSEDTGGVFLAQTNEDSARPEDSERCATEVEIRRLLLPKAEF